MRSIEIRKSPTHGTKVVSYKKRRMRNQHKVFSVMFYDCRFYCGEFV